MRGAVCRLFRVRERLVSRRTGIINQIRAFLLERGIAVRQGLRFLRAELPTILAKRSDALSPRMLRIVEVIRPPLATARNSGSVVTREASSHACTALTGHAIEPATIAADAFLVGL